MADLEDCRAPGQPRLSQLLASVWLCIPLSPLSHKNIIKQRVEMKVIFLLPPVKTVYDILTCFFRKVSNPYEV